MHLRTFCVAVLLAASAAIADVVIKNDTDEQITLVVSSWISSTGNEVYTDSTWNIRAGADTRLLYDDADIYAKTFRWRVRTADGETPEPGMVWTQNAGTDGHVRITVTARDIAASAGRVRVVNNTTWNVELNDCWYVDANGVRQTVSGGWSFEPKETAFLTHKGNDFRARTFRTSLVVGSQSTSWVWQHNEADGEPLTLSIDYDDLVPPATWSPRVTKASPSTFTFCTSSRIQTLVFRLQNLSAQGDVDLFIKDPDGRIVAKCTYSGTTDDRCMLHVAKQGRYTIEVLAHEAEQPINCKVSVTSISHADILAEVVVQEGLEMLIAGGLLEIFGNENEKKEFWEQTGNNLAKDTVALAFIEMLMQVQREKPDIDPLSNDLSTLVNTLSGDDELISVRGAFLDELMQRIRAACR